MGQLVSTTIPGLFNGISQQSVTMRLATQGELQVNALGTIVDGLYHRPNSEHVAIFEGSNAEEAFMHEINRDLEERYVVFITDDETDPIEVYKLDGTQCTIRYGHLDSDLAYTEDASVQDYLDTTEELMKSYKLLSIADYTLVVNRTTVTAMLPDLSPGSIDGTVQTFLDLPDDWANTLAYDATEDYELGDLCKYDGDIYYCLKDIELPLYDEDSWYEIDERCKGTDDKIYICLKSTRPDLYSATTVYTMDDLCRDEDGKIFKYINETDDDGHATTNATYWTEVYDPSAADVLTTYTDYWAEHYDKTDPDALQNTDYWRVEDQYVSEGEVYEIAGDSTNNFDNYFVKFEDGAWAECLAPGQLYKLDASTLPHRLVRTGVNEFTFGPCLWEDRVVGDDDSCPVPSFIGKAITNLTFFKNRLGFLASDSLVFSRAGRYFELFGETAIDLLDDDPIDTIASSTRVVSLYSSIPFDKNLLVNSAQGQFSFGSSGTNLTPTTATLTSTTMYETSKDSDPCAAGANIYFVNPREKYVSIMEYLIQPDTLVEDASDITAHCPHYIPNGTIKVMSCVPMDMLVVFSDGERDALYIYKYYWVGNEKPQSAWSKWTFDGDILGVGLINTELYFTIKRGTEVALEKIQLENIAVNPDFDFRVHLDRQVRVQGVYDVETDKTTWTLPYSTDGSSDFKAINPATGFPIAVTASGNTLVANGDRTAAMYTIGIPYEMRYRFSEWYLKDSKKVSIIDGKLQVRTLTLSYRDTGAFSIEITPYNRETITKRFSGVKVGLSTIGKASLLTGEEKFLVLTKSKRTTIDIVSDSYLPCQITSASFEGMYVTRAQRM